MLDRAIVARDGEHGTPRGPLRSESGALWLPPSADGCVCHHHAAAQLSRSWLKPVRLDYTVSTGRLAVARLLGEVDATLGAPSLAWLVARREGARSRHAPRASETFVDQMLLWEVSFLLPLELFEYPRALFDIEASDRIAIALPAPGLRADAANLLDREPTRRLRPLLRRSVAGLATSLALAAVSNSFVGAASAARVATTITTVTTTTVGHTPAGAPAKLRTRAANLSSCVHATKLSSSAGTTTKSPNANSSGGAPGPEGTPTSDSKLPLACAPAATVLGKLKPSRSGPHAARREIGTLRVPPHKTNKNKPRKHRPRKLATSMLAQSLGAALAPASGPSPLRPEAGSRMRADLERHLRSHAAAPVIAAPSSPAGAGFVIDPYTATEAEQFSTVSASLDQPPAFLIPIYKAAGRRYDIPWQMLAAINAIETNYGQDLAASPKGAVGWMQFMPATWVEYGMDVSGHGRPNPYDPRDAIFSAARLLAANGGAGDIRRALFAYNHAVWYVDMALWRARLITDGATGSAGAGGISSIGGYVNPLTYVAHWERTDQGVDATMLVGAPILAPGELRIMGIEPNWYNGQPLVWWELLDGPDAGLYQYVAEQIQGIAPVGSTLTQGQPIATYAPCGTGVEYGWATVGGETLAMSTSGYAEGYATAAGAWMRSWLNSLGANAGTSAGLSIGAGPDPDDPTEANEHGLEAADHAITTPGYTPKMHDPARPNYRRRAQ